MNTNNPKDDFLARWLEGQLSEEEGRALRASGDLNGLTQVVEETSRFEVPATRTREQAWGEFMDRTREQAPESPSARVIKFPQRPMLVRGLIAASAAILLLIYVLLPQGQVVKTKAGASPLTHALPDGSSALLNDESSLRYAQDWTDLREVSLKGEAFFEVEKGSRFLVHTDYGDVQVLGTSFNVFARNGRLEVVCYTGKVQVQGEKVADKAILSRGESVMIEKGQIYNTNQDISQTGKPGWIDGSFRFQQAPFSLVIEELERQFQVNIHVEKGLEEKQWNGIFFNDDLEEALKMVCKPMGLTYIQDNTTQIRLIHKP